MAARNPRFQLSELGLDCMLFVASALAPLLSAADIIVRPIRTRRVFAAVRKTEESPMTVLRQIWFGRATREALRIALELGMSPSVLRRVVITGNTAALGGPCVYAIYHTPWGRVMAHWLRTRPRTTIYATGRWQDRARTAHLPCGQAGLRRLLSSVRSGACAAVTIDHFSSRAPSCAVCLLGRTVQVSTGPARIAHAAQVPVVPVITRFVDGTIELNLGEPIQIGEESPEKITAALFESFNLELKRDPGGWEGTYSFLEESRGRS
ncbi:MAG: hypothetical protein M3Z18_10430 [Gemmatimonadota bacterium]|nr:hypothetical protein [Gemmatimonadota bacterium]